MQSFSTVIYFLIISNQNTLYLLKEMQFQDPEDTFKRLQIDASDSELREEIKNTFNLMLDLIEEYYNCLQHFPTLKDLTLEINEVRSTNMEKLGKWKFGDSLKSYLNLLYLYLCLNHHQMIYINSFLALLSSLWWFQIGIMWIYLVFPTVPFGIALALEVIQHYAYRKIFGCACRIKKKLPILKVLTQARTPKIPRFDNMRMYRRRRRKKCY